MLTAADFAAFYQQVHHRPCFPWQQDLATRVLDRGWPGLVDVPTGLGKTSLLDIAVFVSAATVSDAGPRRVGRRRTLFVVDRRIVVDEASEYARELADALATVDHEGGAEALAQVAAGLRAYAPDAGGDLLPVTTMRGGTTWEDVWLDRPDRPGIVLGTVDQVGSRLLFRGYGVSDRRRPIDAALVGTDALLLVDEAHLATALTTTVQAVRERDHLGLPLPGVDVVQMSATGQDPGNPFRLDEDAHRSDPVAWKRLTAAKDLFCVETTRKDCDRTIADTALRLLAAHSGGDTAPTALVVCNTVNRARAVHEILTRAIVGGPDPIESPDLLIGRSRPLDREGLQEHVLRRYGTDRAAGATRPAVLVATQTVEVGVNLDVDVLVTESASWNAIVQRLGRLNRLGTYTERFPGHVAAPAVVVHDGQADGPVYGAERDDTWQDLARLAPPGVSPVVDGANRGLGVSPRQCRDLTESFDREAPRQSESPVLLTPILDAWVRTAPVPTTDPPIEAFLHGFDTAKPAVSLTWRGGLLAQPDPFDLDDTGVELPDTVVDQLFTALPVRAAEQVEIPFVAVRQWMSGQPVPTVGDVEFGTDPDEARPKQERDPFRVLAWRVDASGAEATGSTRRWRWIEFWQLRPGDSVVVPAERGGLDVYGWNPSSTAPVLDLGDAATFVRGRSRGRRATLRLDGGLPGRLGLDGNDRHRVLQVLCGLHSSDNRDLTPSDRAQQVTEVLRAVLSRPGPEKDDARTWPADHAERVLPRTVLLRWLEDGPDLVEMVDSRGDVVADREPEALAHFLTGRLPDPGDDADTNTPRGEGAAVDGVVRDDDDPAASSIARRHVTLEQHLVAVRERATEIARALGLPPELVAVIADAAGWHDLGKVEERFQTMLHGGDPYVAALATDPLAKSGMDTDDRVAWVRARGRSRLPDGARHEAWSATLVEAHLRERSFTYAGDEDLLVHLVASHHGHSRPWLPLVSDLAPRPVTAVVGGTPVEVSSATTVLLDGPSRFARLNDRYGRWGLALLETVVRCADMTVSAEGS